MITLSDYNLVDLSTGEVIKTFKELDVVNLNSRPLKFDSKSEVACAVLMEKYIEGWECVPGETYQISVDANRKIDFLVGKTFVEFHPIQLKQEFNSKGALKDFLRALKKLPDEDLAKEIYKSIKDEMFASYAKKRFYAIKYSPVENYKKYDLIVVKDEGDFYDHVLTKLGKKDIPPKKQVLIEWNELMDKQKEKGNE